MNTAVKNAALMDQFIELMKAESEKLQALAALDTPTGEPSKYVLVFTSHISHNNKLISFPPYYTRYHNYNTKTCYTYSKPRKYLC